VSGSPTPQGAFPLGRQARLAVLASGRGSNMLALLRAFPATNPLGRVALVISNIAGAEALESAQNAGVDAQYVPWPDRAAFEEEAGRLLRDAEIDVVCLAGFMRLLSPAFVGAWAGRLVNVHPSLLPSFPGLDAHGQALRAGVAESGCSVHLVDAGVDSGPVILQRRVKVLPGDDSAALAARVLVEEHEAYPEALRRLLTGEWRPPAVEATS